MIRPSLSATVMSEHASEERFLETSGKEVSYLCRLFALARPLWPRKSNAFDILGRYILEEDYAIFKKSG